MGSIGDIVGYRGFIRDMEGMQRSVGDMGKIGDLWGDKGDL